jgi:hypothetical protein
VSRQTRITSRRKAGTKWGIFDGESPHGDPQIHIIPCTDSGFPLKAHIVYWACKCMPKSEPLCDGTELLIHNMIQ